MSGTRVVQNQEFNPDLNPETIASWLRGRSERIATGIDNMEISVSPILYVLFDAKGDQNVSDATSCLEAASVEYSELVQTVIARIRKDNIGAYLDAAEIALNTGDYNSASVITDAINDAITAGKITATDDINIKLNDLSAKINDIEKINGKLSNWTSESQIVIPIFKKDHAVTTTLNNEEKKNFFNDERIVHEIFKKSKQLLFQNMQSAPIITGSTLEIPSHFRKSKFQEACNRLLEDAYSKILAGDRVVIKQNDKVIFDSAAHLSTKGIKNDWLREQIQNLRKFNRHLKDENYVKISDYLPRFKLSPTDQADLLQRLFDADQAEKSVDEAKVQLQSADEAKEQLQTAIVDLAAATQEFRDALDARPRSHDHSEAADITRGAIVEAFNQLKTIHDDVQEKLLELGERSIPVEEFRDNVVNAGTLIDHYTSKIDRLEHAVQSQNAGRKDRGMTDKAEEDKPLKMSHR